MELSSACNPYPAHFHRIGQYPGLTQKFRGRMVEGPCKKAYDYIFRQPFVKRCGAQPFPT